MNVIDTHTELESNFINFNAQPKQKQKGKQINFSFHGYNCLSEAPHTNQIVLCHYDTVDCSSQSFSHFLYE